MLLPLLVFISIALLDQAMITAPLEYPALALLSVGLLLMLHAAVVFLSRSSSQENTKHTKNWSELIWALNSLIMITVCGWLPLVRITWSLESFPILYESLLYTPAVLGLLITWIGKDLRGLSIINLPQVFHRLKPYLLLIVLPVFAGSVLANGLKYHYSELSDTAVIIVSLLGVLSGIVLYPEIIRRLWQLEEIKDEKLVERIQQLAKLADVPCPKVVRWRFAQHHANAASLGFLPGFRYLILTEGFLSQLKETALQDAIFAHEFGHLKLHHVSKKLALVLGLGVLAAISLFSIEAYFSMSILQQVLTQASFSVGLVFLLAFSLARVSHHMEFAADQCATALLQTAGYHNTKSLYSTALTQLNEANRVDACLATWLHPSLTARIAQVL